MDAVDISPQLVQSSREQVELNDLDVNVYESDLFSNVPETSYDVVSWNSPYYRNTDTFLPNLFGMAPDYLSDGGQLIIGYNTFALPRASVMDVHNNYGGRLS